MDMLDLGLEELLVDRMIDHLFLAAGAQRISVRMDQPAQFHPEITSGTADEKAYTVSRRRAPPRRISDDLYG